MFIIVNSINWLAVLTAALASFILGCLWYSKLMFWKAWSKETGKQAIENPAASILAAFVLTLITAFSVALLLFAFRKVTPRITFGVGMLTGVGIAAATKLLDYILENKSLKIFLISAGYQALALLLISLIIGNWK